MDLDVDALEASLSTVPADKVEPEPAPAPQPDPKPVEVDTNQPNAPPVTDPAPATEPTPDPDPEPEPEPKPEEPAPSIDDEPKVKDRMRTTQWSEVDRMAASIVAESGGKVALRDALAKAEELVGKKPDPEPEAKPDPVTPLRDELTALQKKLDEAVEDPALYGKDLRAMQKREAELLADIKVQEFRAEQETKQQEANERLSAADAFDKAWEESVTEATSLYPDAGKDDSALSKAVAAEIEAILSNPKHPLRHEPSLPMILVPKYAARMGIAPTPISAKREPEPEKPKEPVAEVPVKRSPAPGDARTVPVVQKNEAQKTAELKESLAKASRPEEAGALLEQFLGGDNAQTGSLVLA